MIPRIPLGSFSVSPHGVGIAVGYFIGALLMARRARRIGFDEDETWNAAVAGVLGAIVGARTAYVIGHTSQFDSPIEYLQIYKGGISLAGALLGGFLAAYIYCRRKGIDFVQVADLGAPGLALGIAVGRIGDLVIGDHLGKETSGFWGWEYRGGELISSPPCDTTVYSSPTGCIEPGMVVHQTALYDSIWSLAILGILTLAQRRPRPKGFLVLTWASLYSIGRVVTDFTRVDKTWFGTGLTGSQLTALVVLGACIYGLYRIRNNAPGGVAAHAESPAEPEQAGGSAEIEPEASQAEEKAAPSGEDSGPTSEDEAVPAGQGAASAAPAGETAGSLDAEEQAGEADEETGSEEVGGRTRDIADTGQDPARIGEDVAGSADEVPASPAPRADGAVLDPAAVAPEEESVSGSPEGRAAPEQTEPEGAAEGEKVPASGAAGAAERKIESDAGEADKG